MWDSIRSSLHCGSWWRIIEARCSSVLPRRHFTYLVNCQTIGSIKCLEAATPAGNQGRSLWNSSIRSNHAVFVNIFDVVNRCTLSGMRAKEEQKIEMGIIIIIIIIITTQHKPHSRVTHDDNRNLTLFHIFRQSFFFTP